MDSDAIWKGGTHPRDCANCNGWSCAEHRLTPAERAVIDAALVWREHKDPSRVQKLSIACDALRAERAPKPSPPRWVVDDSSRWIHIKDSHGIEPIVLLRNHSCERAYAERIAAALNAAEERK